MGEQPVDLAEAECKVREFAAEGCDCNHFPVYELEALLAEYERRGRVVKAATAYVAYANGKWFKRAEEAELFNALADAVKEVRDA